MFNPGRYYVIYPDGYESMGMPRRIARSYARMFGGVVRSDPKEPCWFARKLAVLRARRS